MIIELDKIPVMWVTCEKTVIRRKEGMLDALRQLGVMQPEQVNGRITQSYHVGFAESYFDAVTRHKPPFLILEDDARLIPGNEASRFEIPDADALYLGTTTYGRQRKATSIGSVISSDVNPDYIRTYNMLAMHAVVFLTQEYANHVSRMMARYITSPIGGCDDLVADTMHHWRVLCRRRPVFFQNDGKAEKCTTDPLTTNFTEIL